MASDGGTGFYPKSHLLADDAPNVAVELADLVERDLDELGVILLQVRKGDLSSRFARADNLLCVLHTNGHRQVSGRAHEESDQKVVVQRVRLVYAFQGAEAG